MIGDCDRGRTKAQHVSVTFLNNEVMNPFNEIFQRCLTQLLVDHAELVRQQILGATKDENLGIRALGAKNARIKGQLELDAVDAIVIRSTGRVLVLRILGIRPHVDELILVAGSLVELVRLDEAEILSGAGLHAGRISELDGGLAHGIEDETRGLVGGSREVEIIRIGPVLGANDPEILKDAVVELETRRVLDTGRDLRRTGSRIISLGRDHLELVEHLRKGNLAKLVALLIVEVHIGALHAALEIALLERRERERAIRKARIDLLIGNTVGAYVDLAVAGIDNGIRAGAEVDLENDLVEGERDNRKRKGTITAEAKRERNPESVAALGPGNLLLDGIKLANKLVRELGRAARERIPDVHEAVGQRIDDGATDGKRDVLEDSVPDRVVPIGSLGDDLVVLDADEARKVDARIRVPRKVALTRHHVLGRSAEAGLRRRRIIVHGLKGVREVLLVDEPPEAHRGLLESIRNQDLVRVALGGKFSPNGIVSCAHLFHRHTRTTLIERITNK